MEVKAIRQRWEFKMERPPLAVLTHAFSFYDFEFISGLLNIFKWEAICILACTSSEILWSPLNGTGKKALSVFDRLYITLSIRGRVFKESILTSDDWCVEISSCMCQLHSVQYDCELWFFTVAIYKFQQSIRWFDLMNRNTVATKLHLVDRVNFEL